jgi:thioredoxin 1
MAPSLEAIATEHAGRIHIAKLDIESNARATERHQVRSLPTLIVFRGGEELTRLVGLKGKARLLTELAPYLD